MANRSQRRAHRFGRGGPRPPKDADLRIVEGVLLDGQPYAVVSWLCTDPDCLDGHDGPSR